MPASAEEKWLANALGALALTASDRIGEAAQAATGCGAAETSALVILATTLGGGSQESLRGALALTQSGVVRVVDRLTAAGLVERSPGPDRRTYSLRVTAAGRRLARRALRAREAALEEALEPLTARQRRELASIVGTILGDAPADLPGSHRICRLCDPGVCEGEGAGCPVTAGLAARAPAP